MGFVPGADFAMAINNPAATTLDYVVGVVGIIPGSGKLASLFLRGGGKILFRSTHYSRRLERNGLDVNQVESAVRAEVEIVRPNLAPRAPFSGRIEVNDQPVEYHAFPLENGDVSVGTIF